MRKGTGKNANAWRIVSSCLKTVSNSAGNVVRSAVAAVSSFGNDRKDRVLLRFVYFSTVSCRCLLQSLLSLLLFFDDMTSA